MRGVRLQYKIISAKVSEPASQNDPLKIRYIVRRRSSRRVGISSSRRRVNEVSGGGDTREV